MKTWINDVLQHAQSYDYDDYIEWKWGTIAAFQLGPDCVPRGIVVEPHDYPMPLWLEQQLHFENVVTVIALRVRYALGNLLCRWFGHPDACVDVQEGDAEAPWVSWSCSRCGNGGTSWW